MLRIIVTVETVLFILARHSRMDEMYTGPSLPVNRVRQNTRFAFS